MSAQTVIVLALIALVLYEAVAIGIATFQVDDAARDVAAAAARSYSGQEDLAAARDAADDRARATGVEVLSVSVDGGHIVAEVRKEARTVLAHRIDALRGATRPSSSVRVSWR